MHRCLLIFVGLSLGLGLAACAGKPQTTASTPSPLPTPPLKAPSKSFDPYAICRELYPCLESRDRHDNGPPFMCALSGQRVAREEEVNGVVLESVACPFRRLGASGFVGVPVDGGPHLKGQALLDRVRSSPRARALAALSLHFEWIGEVTIDSVRDHELRFRPVGGLFDTKECVLSKSDSIACAYEHPERLLALCNERRGAGEGKGSAQVRASHSYWGTSQGSSPSDHIKNREFRWKDFPRPPEVELRSHGHLVRLANCGEEESFLAIDEEPQRVVTRREIIGKLDDLSMRASMATTMLDLDRVEGPTLLLDPVGGKDAFYTGAAGCRLAPGPRESNGKLSFYVHGGGEVAARLLHCEVSTTTWQGGRCEDVAPGTFCQ